jgi:hypothetical protein
MEEATCGVTRMVEASRVFILSGAMFCENGRWWILSLQGRMEEGVVVAASGAAGRWDIEKLE